MSKDLFIAKLPANTSPEELKVLFETVGRVTFVKRPRDFETGAYRSFAFVSMSTDEEGIEAVNRLNGYILDDVAMVVKASDKPIITTPMPKSPPSPSSASASSSPAPHLPNFVWEDRLDEIEPLLNDVGTATTAKITLVGRPASHTSRAGVVVIALQNFPKQTGLPKGIPVPPPIPVLYMVYISQKMWSRVADSIKDPEDALIIEGQVTIDPEAGGIAVIATNVNTKLLQRSQFQAESS
jgi:hypothetical protein